MKQEVFPGISPNSGISPSSSSLPPTSVSDSETLRSHGNRPQQQPLVKRSASSGGRSLHGNQGLFARATRSVSNERGSAPSSDKSDAKGFFFDKISLPMFINFLYHYSPKLLFKNNLIFLTKNLF